MIAGLNELKKASLLIYTIDIFICALTSWLPLVFINADNHYILLPLAILSFYRGHAFIHEVVHQKNKIPQFEFIYNLLFGYPNNYPSYIYYPHHYHHSKKTYGTEKDPEYLYHLQKNFLRPFLVSIFLPAFNFFRFTLLPLFYPFMSRNVKVKIFQRVSTLVVNSRFVRLSIHLDKDLKVMAQHDLVSSIYSLSIMAVIYLLGSPITFFSYWYLTMIIISLLNTYRAAKSHHYQYNSNCELSFEEQIQDTTTLPENIFSFILAPLGLSYHVAHHMHPTIPYYNLKKAHRLLMNDEDYLKTLKC